MKRNLKTNAIALIGLMGALSSVLMMFKFPLPLMPPFMDFDLAGMIAIIGGFLLGPMAAVFIILVKLLLKLVTVGSTSMLTGEIQNFILSCAYVLPAVFFYQKHKNKKSAVIGMLIGTLVCAVIAIFTNFYIIIPFYINLFGMSMESIISMCAAVNPFMNNALTLALFGIVPFNLIKNGITSLVVLVIYKKVTRPLKNFIQ